MSKAQLRWQELKLTKDAVQNLATKLNEAEEVLVAFQKQLKYLHDNMMEQSTQPLSKDTDVVSEHGRLSNFMEDMASFSMSPNQARTQSALKTYLLNVFKTALVSQEMENQHCIFSFIWKFE